MKRDISIYIKDVLENITRMEIFINGMQYDDFVNDEKTHYAVIRCIEIIGEAVKHVPLPLEKNIRKYHGKTWLA